MIDKFLTFYQQFNRDELAHLNQVYDTDIEFIDPLHQVNGLPQLTTYFEQVMSNVSQCDFDILETLVEKQAGCVSWNMRFKHHRLNQGNVITVNGMSHIRWVRKIIYHRDYFDLGQMVYQHIPLLKHGINAVNNRLSKSNRLSKNSRSTK
ncbi:MAG: transcriptional regulator [Kangiellaceae bacterium]|nr:transcriptional regulator [Kangiellaceae bacterium]|tara:strand:+ start:498 stop:947 length:450 start_codon:yes stop_codon:yes gene_type:complete